MLATAAGLGTFLRYNTSTGAESATASRSAVASRRKIPATAARNRQTTSNAKPTSTARSSPRSVIVPVTTHPQGRGVVPYQPIQTHT